MGLPAPSDLHLPSKFKVWRKEQERAIQDILHFTGDRFLLQVVPTGVGKSLIYTTAAWMMEGRSVILTSTKGLQSQLSSDFAQIGMVEIKGRKAYGCMRGDGPTADHGLCHFGVTCEYREKGCEYYDAVRKAADSRIVVTNYAYWMTAGDRLGTFDRVFMDEGHEAPRHLSDQLTVEIDLEEMGKAIGGPVNQVGSSRDWGDWARAYGNIVDALLEEIQRKLVNNPTQIWLLRKLFGFKIRLEKMESYSLGHVVMDKQKSGFRIDPVHIAPYAPASLFRGVEFVIITSATATAKTASIMGIEPTLVEYRSDFPVVSRPVVHIPTVGVSHRITPSEEEKWLRVIDQIIDKRLDRKGIIHTVSYDRAQKIMKNSRNRGIIRSNSSSTLPMTVGMFKKDSPPSILISPVVTTGWDFPYTECEYQVISKIAFPDSRSAIMEARSKADPEYPMYIAIQTLVQACGRGMRAADDRCETLVIDDNFRWLMGKYGKLAPEWFRESIIWGRTIPTPLPKLRR